mmetsp:Transcript_62782/g.72157  ORF Transcript_62782/g.72157 Transcript_62782/m.72157 type:complete len:213 (-) Transcript_62782:1767-2405(-)
MAGGDIFVSSSCCSCCCCSYSSSGRRSTSLSIVPLVCSNRTFTSPPVLPSSRCFCTFPATPQNDKDADPADTDRRCFIIRNGDANKDNEDFVFVLEEESIDFLERYSWSRTLGRVVTDVDPVVVVATVGDEDTVDGEELRLLSFSVWIIEVQAESAVGGEKAPVEEGNKVLRVEDGNNNEFCCSCCCCCVCRPAAADVGPANTEGEVMVVVA